MTKAEQLRVKRDKHPTQPRARTDTQKDYAQKCAKAGNLSKANQTIRSELIPSCDENTLPQLQDLHPPGDLNFNRQFWPEEQAIRDYWASAEGQEVVDKHFSLKKIRQYFRNRKPLVAADVDGWRGREHLAWMFMNNDTEFHIEFEGLMPPYDITDPEMDPNAPKEKPIKGHFDQTGHFKGTLKVKGKTYKVDSVCNVVVDFQQLKKCIFEVLPKS